MLEHKTSKRFREVRELMKLMKQDTPESPVIPDEKVRLLRAKLILEEALETIEALAVNIKFRDAELKLSGDEKQTTDTLSFGLLEFEPLENDMCDILQVIDGCCDIEVVTLGTLVAFGVADDEMAKEVHLNNMKKIENGKQRKDGKWEKPKGHKPPYLEGMLEEQGWTPNAKH